MKHRRYQNQIQQEKINMKQVFIILIIIVYGANLLAQGPKRNRAEGTYNFICSNTEGYKNWWLKINGSYFLWANKIIDTTVTQTQTRPGHFPFGEISTSVGITSFASLMLESRIFSYIWDHWFQFGNIAIGTKLTLPNNKELRFSGYGLQIKYIWNNNAINFPSLAGYRVGSTGFAPEGYIVGGSNLEIKYLNDYDFIALYTWLPLKVGYNAGIRIPFAKAEYIFPLYLFSVCISWCELYYDFFVEYSLEAFNNISAPKAIQNLGHTKTEVWFSENLMYITLGGRIRYDNGITLFLCVPFLLSYNKGSAMTREDLTQLNRSTSPGTKFYDEYQRGITDPFDPWFAKWKVIAQISFPIMYNQTATEMMRNFLLLKNKKKEKKFDIDNYLNKKESDTLGQSEEEKKRRLEEIQKRREKIEKKEQ
jgi:hypothetical protein